MFAMKMRTDDSAEILVNTLIKFGHTATKVPNKSSTFPAIVRTTAPRHIVLYAMKTVHAAETEVTAVFYSEQTRAACAKLLAAMKFDSTMSYNTRAPKNPFQLTTTAPRKTLKQCMQLAHEAED